MFSRDDITALILSGGEGTRVGGRDKGLLAHAGKALVAHALERVAPQCAAVLISCNRNFEEYARLGVPLVPDTVPEFEGPLAGMLSAAEHVGTELCLVVPCDCPTVPLDLAKRLLEGLRSGARASVVHDGTRLQPLFLLVHARELKGIRGHLASGPRSVMSWLAELDPVAIDFSGDRDRFVNLNRLEDLGIDPAQ